MSLERKIGNPSSQENLVMTSAYERANVRPSVRPYVRPDYGGGEGSVAVKLTAERKNPILSERASTGGEGQTVLNNAVNYNKSRAWENTEQCREAKLTRAVQKEAKYPISWPRTLQNSRVEMPCRRAKKVTWYHLVINERNQTWLCMF